MVETEVVIKETLSTQLVDDGKLLLSAVDSFPSLSIDGFFWFYMTDINRWRLIIATSKVDIDGTRETYKWIQTVIDSLGQKSFSIQLQDIAVLSPNHPLIKLLGLVVTKESGSSGLRFSRNVINGTFIEDAYIYRLI